MYLRINDTRGLVFNQFTGGTMVVDRAWWESLGIFWIDGRFEKVRLQETPTLGDTQYWQTLVDLGFVTTSERHVESVQKLVDFGKRFQKERQTTFFITPQTQKRGCPLSCGYCFEKAVEPERERLLEDGGVEAVVNFIILYQKTHNLASEKISLQLFGGEPVQDRFYDFWHRILSAVRTHGWRWSVVTSGATFTPKMFDLFSEFAPYGLQEFNITLDGIASVHNALRPFKSGGGTHELIVNNVDELLRRDLPVLLKTNFGKDNIGTYREHLDNVLSRGWQYGNFVLMVNVIQSFGGLNTEGHTEHEDSLMLKIIEVFRTEPYRGFVPLLRLEGKKLTGYLANTFGLPFSNTENLRRGKPVFEAYPYHAFCNPTKGNSWNIAPDGTLRTCNWMSGHEGFGEGSIFDLDSFVGGRFTNHVACNNHCSGCDISTLCGGGCAIDINKQPGYFDTCRVKYGAVVEAFVLGCVERGWLDLRLEGRPFRILRSGFDFDYTYHDRFDPQKRISTVGAFGAI